MFTTSDTGRTSEWASSLTKEEREDVNALAVRYLSKLYQATGVSNVHSRCCEFLVYLLR